MKKIRIHRKNYNYFFPTTSITYILLIKKGKSFSEIGTTLTARDIGETGFYPVKTYLFSELINLIEKVIETFPKNTQNEKNLLQWEELLNLCKIEEKKENIENE